jgi:hypothetical protein
MIVLATFAQFLPLHESPKLVSAFWPLLTTQNQPFNLVSTQMPIELTAGKHPTQFILILDLHKNVVKQEIVIPIFLLPAGHEHL